MDVYPKLSIEAQNVFNSLSSAEKTYILCGTGHRPTRLGLSYSVNDFKLLMNFARQELQKLNLPNNQIVISGAALGWDQALAEAAVLENYELWMAVPFKNFSANWSPIDKLRHNSLCQKATKVIYTSDDEYNKALYYYRDVFMVQCSNKVLSLYDNSPYGGTYITQKYALEAKKEVINLYDNFLKYKKQKDGVI